MPPHLQSAVPFSTLQVTLLGPYLLNTCCSVCVAVCVLQYVCCSVCVAVCDNDLCLRLHTFVCITGDSARAVSFDNQNATLQLYRRWCSVVPCGAAWCSVLKCVTVCCSVVCGAMCCSEVQRDAVCCSVMPCGAVWCSMVQRGAMWCSVVQLQRYSRSYLG